MTLQPPSTPSDAPPKAISPGFVRSLALFVVLNIPNHSTRMMENTTYRLKKLPRRPGVIPPSWQMTKLTESGCDGETYTIHRDNFGWHCTCASGTYRHQNTAERCKHCDCLIAAGLMGDELA